MYKVLVSGVKKKASLRERLLIIISGIAEAVVFKVKLFKSKTL